MARGNRRGPPEAAQKLVVVTALRNVTVWGLPTIAALPGDASFVCGASERKRAISDEQNHNRSVRFLGRPFHEAPSRLSE